MTMAGLNRNMPNTAGTSFWQEWRRSAATALSTTVLLVQGIAAAV